MLTQELLMHIHTTFGSKVFVVYASPAINDINELVAIHLDRKLFEHSNFKKASELNGHGRNTYIKAGTFSIACSNPKKIEDFDLIKELEQLTETDVQENNENNRQFIKGFSKKIISLTNENKYFSTSFQKLNETISKVDEYELFHSFLVMRNFRQLTGAQWLIKI